ncbi:hypothetical protein Tco_1557775, partial [Tanacetum coccineum]
DGGDDDDDDDSSDDDEVEKEASEEEEEHLALADSVITPAVDLVPSFEETEQFKMDESAATPPPPPPPLGVRISILPQAPMPQRSRDFLPYLHHHHYHSSHYHHPMQRNALLGFRAAMGRLRASSPSTHHPLHPSPPLPPLPSSLYLPPPVPTSSPLPSPPLPPLPASLFIPPPVDRKEDIPEVELPPRKRLCLTALTSGYEVGESSTDAARPTGGHRADYRFIGTLDAKTRRQRAEEVGYGIRDVWVDPTEAVEEIAPTTLKGFNARVIELVEEIVLLMEQEALVSRESWAQSVGLSSAGQLSVALGQIQALQARDPTHADDPEGTDSCA